MPDSDTPQLPLILSVGTQVVSLVEVRSADGKPIHGTVPGQDGQPPATVNVTYDGDGSTWTYSGVDGDTVLFNDPDGGVKKTGLLAWFNTKRYRLWPSHVLVKDPARY